MTSSRSKVALDETRLDIVETWDIEIDRFIFMIREHSHFAVWFQSSYTPGTCISISTGHVITAITVATTGITATVRWA